jgi:hypothetical protein
MLNQLVQNMLGNFYQVSNPAKSVDPIKAYYETRFEVYYDDHRNGWAVRYQADQSLENDWFFLNKDGSLEEWCSPNFKVHYYPSEFSANVARKEFVIRKCVESYEYKLRIGY